jgi:hypothetical protein
MISVSNSKLFKGWNWGAFLLGPLWALINQVWIGLIAWLPILLVFIVIIFEILTMPMYPFNDFLLNIAVCSYIVGENSPVVLQIYFVWYLFNVFILGLKGNEWALRTVKIENVRYYKRRQKILSIVGFLFGVPLVYATFLCFEYLIGLNGHLYMGV